MLPALLAASFLAAALTGVPGAHRDPEIEKALAQVSPERARATVETLVAFGTRHTLSDQISPGRGIGAARRWLERAFKEAGAGRLEVEVQSFVAPAGPRVKQPTEIGNVLAWLRGADPASARRVYVVSGHYDSRASDPLDAEAEAPGADDDASGVAVVLEVARVLAPFKHDATLLFAAVAGEEQGLLGSEALAKKLKDEGYQVAGMFTNDIVGSVRGGNGVTDGSRVRVFSEGMPEAASDEERRAIAATGGENDSPSRNLARFIRDVADLYQPTFAATLVFRRDRYLRGGDHIPFLRAGFPAVRFTEPAEDYRHQHQNVRTVDGVEHGDLVKFVDFDYVVRVARANAAALAALARAPAPPSDAALATAELSNDTTLTWSRGAEPDLAGYLIRIRATTAPFWERAVDAGDATSLTLAGVSKDDLVFGVAAYDRDGHVSPATFPRPRSAARPSPLPSPSPSPIPTPRRP